MAKAKDLDTVEHETMQLDDSVTDQDIGPAKDLDGIPYCRVHHCRMDQASGGRKDSPTAYFACPVPECKETGQRIKTPRESIVPRSPLACPRCSKQESPVYCERDTKCSTAASVILKCPDCGWKSNAMAVPQLAAAHFARRHTEITAGVGDR